MPRSNDNVAARKLLQRPVLNKLSFGKALGCRGMPTSQCASDISDFRSQSSSAECSFICKNFQTGGYPKSLEHQDEITICIYTRKYKFPSMAM